jgi:hypothetical protein
MAGILELQSAERAVWRWHRNTDAKPVVGACAPALPLLLPLRRPAPSAGTDFIPAVSLLAPLQLTRQSFTEESPTTAEQQTCEAALRLRLWPQPLQLRHLQPSWREPLFCCGGSVAAHC